jgi:hypothetical protein
MISLLYYDIIYTISQISLNPNTYCVCCSGLAGVNLPSAQHSVASEAGNDPAKEMDPEPHMVPNFMGWIKLLTQVPVRKSLRFSWLHCGGICSSAVLD